MTPHRQAVVDVKDGPEKLRLLYALTLDDATHPIVRDTAVRIVRSAPRYDHVERIARLHRFVRDCLDYHREPVEMFQHSAVTLQEGGDCDDLIRTLCALAWAVKYPFIIDPIPNEHQIDHFTCRIGYPESNNPHGDAHTTWIPCEVSMPALTGETVQAAERRIG